jgi:hypothetical protein
MQECGCAWCVGVPVPCIYFSLSGHEQVFTQSQAACSRQRGGRERGTNGNGIKLSNGTGFFNHK